MNDELKLGLSGLSGAVISTGSLILFYIVVWPYPPLWFWVPMAALVPGLGMAIGYNIGLRRWFDTGLFRE